MIIFIIIECLLFSLCMFVFGIAIYRALKRHIDVIYAPKFYITGDKHRDFKSVKSFCKRKKTRREDVLIILGDAGLNYYCDEMDDKLKRKVSKLPITLFCIHGNKEKRPQNIDTYGIRNFCTGKVYYEPKYPNINFAIDGEVYAFEGRKYLVVGGAHSVNKLECLAECLPYWDDEMPDNQVKSTVEEKLRSESNRIYGMLTHTCPMKYIPTEMLMSTKAAESTESLDYPLDIDRSTEEWLDKLEETVDYQIWYCGHYHIDKEIDKLHMMYREINPLHDGK